MFKKKEHGFSLVELSVAAAVAIGLAVVAVTVVSGTAASVSEKGSSAASVETCTISESLAKSGGDEEATNCNAGGSQVSESGFGTPTTAWHAWLEINHNYVSVMGGEGTIENSYGYQNFGTGGYALAGGIGDGASLVGGLNGWAIKIGDSLWLPFNIKEMADGMIFDDGSQWGTWNFMELLYNTHGITNIPVGTSVQFKTPDGTYSNIYVTNAAAVFPG